MKEYKTVLSPSFGEYEEKRSRFLARLVPCESAERAAEIMSRLKQEYWDARHNVYAYVLTDGATRFSDDGEPHGTAGKPVFDTLAGSGICGALLSVTRYFGGTLLGTGGLVRAYSSAAREAVLAAKPVVMRQGVTCSLTCSYSEHPRLSRLISDCGGSVSDTSFGENVVIKASFRLEEKENFLSKLCEAFSGRLSAEDEEIGYFAEPENENS